METKGEMFFQSLIEIAPKQIWSVNGKESYTAFVDIDRVKELEAELEYAIKDFRSSLMNKRPEDRITIIEYTIHELLIPYETSRLAMGQFPDPERDEGRATMLLLSRTISAIRRLALYDLQLAFTDDFIEYWERRKINMLLGEVNKKDGTNSIPLKSNFSVTEWATAFYYAVGRVLPDNRGDLIFRIEEFMEKHNIQCSSKSLKNKYYEIKKRINGGSKQYQGRDVEIEPDYPVKKLQKIIPFIEKNYPDSANILENEINFLEGQ